MKQFLIITFWTIFWTFIFVNIFEILIDAFIFYLQNWGFR